MSRDKVPQMECEVTFLSEQEGGRKTGLPTLSGGKYRPLLVIGDPNQRQAKIVGRMMPVEYADGSKGEQWTDKYIDEEHLGVIFESGPDSGEVGKPLTITVSLPFWSPIPEFEKFEPGVTFTLREGSVIVGFGRALRWLSPP